MPFNQTSEGERDLFSFPLAVILLPLNSHKIYPQHGELLITDPFGKCCALCEQVKISLKFFSNI